MTTEPATFFTASLSAGAILTGFCGTFLSFRIQREASYYRQPAVDFASGSATDVYIGLSHFSSSFLLISGATVLAVVFGFILPLFGVAGVALDPRLVVAGIVAALIFVLGYFVCEMVPYGVLSSRLLNDRSEWGRERFVVLGTALVSIVVATFAWHQL